MDRHDRHDRRTDPAGSGRTLPEILELRARAQGGDSAYILLGGDEHERERLSYAELAARARGIAAELAARGLAGCAAVLLYPNDLDFVCAFLGCLYAGVRAVPCYPPSAPDKHGRFAAIARDCGAAIGLCSASLRGLLPQLDAALAPSPLEWLYTETLPGRSEPATALPDPQELALLQYTSGSTASPKGVMVSHANLMANAAAITSLGAHPPRAHSVSWLPLYHDMGLIGGVVTSLYTNVPVVLMSPLDFLRRPALWLRAISRYRAVTSGAPNFAYELCVTRVAARHCQDLELSCWRNAFNGAEPIRAATLARFAEKFAPFGFRPRSFFTCYGLAESTLLVSAVPSADAPRVASFERAALELGRAVPAPAADPGARELVSCGRRPPGHRVEIVSAETGEPLPEGRIGEIWVAGPSVARGYWGRPAATRETFAAELRGAPGAPFLRSGDLGFLDGGELFVTGRAKDLLIVRGRNCYPQDLEQCAQASPEIRTDGCAAFAVEIDGEEQPVLVCELQHAGDRASYRSLAAELRSRIAAELDVRLYAVVLVRPGSVPKTSSGKVRRADCRALWASGALSVLFEDAPPSTAADEASADPATALLREMLRASGAAQRAPLLEPYLRVRAAALAGVAPEQVRPERSLPEAGLDSLRMLDLKHELDALLGAELPLRALVEARSLRELAAAAAALAPARAPAGRAAPAAAEASLSEGQAAVWFLHARHPDTPAYNMHLALRVRGPLDRERLQRAIDLLVDRHPILRTGIELRDGQPRPVLHPERRIAVEVVDARDLGERRVREEPAHLAARPFDLARGEVARVQLLVRSADEHVLALAVHHVAVDFWSIVTLVHELSQSYAALGEGRAPSLPPLARSYADFARWQRDYLERRGAQDARYWHAQLGGDPQRLELPLDRPRPAEPSFRGASVPLAIGAATRDALRELGAARGATLYMTLLAGFAALLHRYTGQTDLIIGTPLAGRPDPSYAGVVGYFANPVALRARPRPGLRFSELLEQVRSTVIGALEHQHYPFARVVEALRPEREPNRWPLYQVAFTLQTPHLRGEAELAALALGEAHGAMDWGGLRVEAAGLEERVENFDLKLAAAESADGLLASFQYNADLFDAASMERLARHLGTLLASAARDAEQRLGELELLDAAELDGALRAASGPPLRGAPGRLDERFEAIARASPDALAIREPGRHWSYAELNARANQLGRALRARGVRDEAPVLLLLERSGELAAAQLAVLKAGGSFVPLDADAPTARLAEIARQLGAACCVARRPLPTALAELPSLLLERDAEEIARQPATDLALGGSEHALAYAVLTSGSTGRPHGALNTHTGLRSLCDWHRSAYALTPRDRASWLARLGFDAALWELWPYLLAGASLHVPPDDALRADPAELLRWLAEQQVSVAFLATPLAERALREPLPAGLALRALLTGGERLGPCAGAALPFRVVNHYGPSECSVVATAADVRFGAADEPPIGAPIAGVRAHVLDADLRPLPAGVVGELWLGGTGVGRGYAGEPALTAARFLPDPFAPEPGARLYRTGDRARRGADGLLHFVGRRDQQVKLRGHRIELGELEGALAALPGVQACAALLRDDPQRLVAYVHGEPPAAPGAADLVEQHVAEWTGLFDDTYAASAADVAPDLDLSGWNSSYTGAPLPEADMREWVEQTVAAIRALRPRRILEIGVGTGLLLQRLAPDCEAYSGTDVSRAALRALGERIAGEPWAARVALHCGAAHEPLPAGPADVVVLNSVAQYFPSLAYLRGVLQRALEQLAPGGALFVGDVRALPWLGALLADVALEQVAPSTTLAALAARVEEQRARVRELALDPHALARWLGAQPGVTHCEVRLKAGARANELTRFRCDVVAQVRGPAPERVAAEAWTDGAELAALRAPRTAARFALTGIPNARVARPLALLAALRAGERTSAAELRRQLAGLRAGIDPAELAARAQEQGLRARLLASPADPGAFDAILEPLAAPDAPLRIAAGARAEPGPEANAPLRERLRRAWLPELRRALAERLPDYMLPAQIALLERWPRTPSGKTDRRALPPPEPEAWRGALVAPRTPREAALAEIFCAVLGLDRVGIHDGFFELGGDSILSIQLVHRARGRGLYLQPRHVFEHQTIARLAAVARDAPAADVPQQPFRGPVPWTPISAWWRDLALADPHHWNQSVLLEAPRELEPGALRAALRAVAAHHDMLRLRLRAGALEVDACEDAELLSEVEIVGPEPAAGLAAHGARLQAALDLERGPIFRALHARCPGLAADRLLLTAHHLAVDAVSWRILAEDLSAAYLQARAGQVPSLPPRTAPFAEWAARLGALARADDLGAERELWQRQLRALAPLPRDLAAGDATEATRREVAVELAAGATQVLLRAAHTAYRARPEELLLAALGRAVGGWAGRSEICLDYESHGRAALDGIDVSRTVGWFTVAHPLALRATSDLEADLCHAKEALRSLPRAGAGWGLLRQQPGTEPDHPRELAFNYLGRIDAGLEVADGFRLARESAGSACAPRARRPYLIDVNAALRGGALELRFAYSAARHTRATLEALARATLEELRALLAACARPGAGRLTPSDFPLAALAPADLAHLALEHPQLEDVYPLTPLQEGLWLHARLASDASMYAVQLGFEIEGALDVDALEQAWQRLVARHAALRSALVEGPERPLQVVLRELDAPLRLLDWRGDAPASLEARLAAWLEADRAQGFDLARPPLARLQVLRLEDARARLVLTHHHAILDGWSLPVLLHELLRSYEAERRGAPLELPAPPEFRAHVEQLLRGDPAPHEGFWRARLAGRDAEPLFGALPRRPASGSLRARRALGRELSSAVERRAREWGLTVHTLALGAFALALARCTGRSDLVLGSVSSGRDRGDTNLERAVGLYIRTLPVRVRLAAGRELRAWLQELQDEQRVLGEHGGVPLAQIERWSGASLREPLFECVFAFESYPIEAALRGAAHELGVRSFEYWDRTHYALTAVVSPAGGERWLDVTYDAARFDAAQIEALVEQFRHALGTLAGTAAVTLGALPPLAGAALRALAPSLRPQRKAAAAAVPTLERFAAHAAAQPSAPAVRAGGAALSYGELDRLASGLAERLRERGVGAEDRVAVCLPRDATLAIALVGVLRAGAVCVPLDPEHPDARLAEIVRDAGARLALVAPGTRAQLPAGLPALCLELGGELLAGASGAGALAPAHPEQLAYVIYTSGSTGTAKGVGVPQRALARLLDACAARFDFAPADRWSLLHSAAFDFSVFELWGALTTGGCCVVVPEPVRRDSAALLELLAAERVSVLCATPAAFDGLLAALETGPALPALRWIVFGGDELHPDRLRPWFERAGARARLANLYGITETTVHVTFGALDAARLLPPPASIGRALPHLAVQLLGRDGLLVPPGWVGEIHVAGAGVARGYLGQPALTAERFLPDAFAEEPGARVYRSGDLARWRADGELEYLGRCDAQVQLRGHRIELGEIEARLEAQPGVRRAAAALRGGRLVAFVVADPGTDLAALRAGLTRELPAALVPHTIAALDALPLTPNGKLDRRALPEPERAPSRGGEPSAPLEAELHALWTELLDAPQIGVHDDFFALGGDSILAVQLASRAHRRGIRLRPRQIFEQPTIAALARLALDAPPLRAEQGPVAGALPPTPIQHWWAAQALPRPEHWNQALLLDVRTPLEPALLRAALDALVAHHDALRLTWPSGAEELWNAASAPPAAVHTADLSSVPEPALAAALDAACAPAQRGFALDAGPLLAAAYLQLGAARGQRLLLCAHHLAIDAVSWRLLLEDLEAAYRQVAAGRAIELPPKTTSYREWALRVAERARSEPAEPVLDFWSGLAWDRVRPLPLDLAGGPNLESSADTLGVTLDAVTTGELFRDVAQSSGARPDDVLLTALAQVLCAWTGGSAAALVLEGHGRDELADGVDVSRTVGWFTSLYPLVLTLAGGSPLDELKSVKEQLRRAPERGRAYGRQRYAGSEFARSVLAALPAPQVSFNQLGHVDAGFGGDVAFAAACESSGPARALEAPRAHLIDVTARVQGGRLQIDWTYARSHHTRAGVERLAALHLERVRALVRACQSSPSSGLTPSDFPLAAGLDQAALDRLIARARMP